MIVAPKDKEAGKYDGATILMPNVGELARLVGTRADGDAWLEDSAARLSRDLRGLETVLVTRGSTGMTLFEREANGMRRVDIPTVARKVYDVTGAGDTALAAFGASVAAGASVELAAHLANIAAGIVVGKRGTAVVTSEEILAHSREEKSEGPSTQEEPEILRALSGR